MNLITLQTEWDDSQAYQTEASWQQSTINTHTNKNTKINELCTALAAITVQLRTNSSSSGGHGYGGRGMETETMEVNEDIGGRGWGSPNGCGNRGGQSQRGILCEKSDQDRHHTGWKIRLRPPPNKTRRWSHGKKLQQQELLLHPWIWSCRCQWRGWAMLG